MSDRLAGAIDRGLTDSGAIVMFVLLVVFLTAYSLTMMGVVP